MIWSCCSKGSVLPQFKPSFLALSVSGCSADLSDLPAVWGHGGVADGAKKQKQIKVCSVGTSETMCDVKVIVKSSQLYVHSPQIPVDEEKML